MTQRQVTLLLFDTWLLNEWSDNAMTTTDLKANEVRRENLRVAYEQGYMAGFTGNQGVNSHAKTSGAWHCWEVGRQAGEGQRLADEIENRLVERRLYGAKSTTYEKGDQDA